MNLYCVVVLVSPCMALVAHIGLRTDFSVVHLLTNRYCVVLKRISEAALTEVDLLILVLVLQTKIWLCEILSKPPHP